MSFLRERVAFLRFGFYYSWIYRRELYANVVVSLRAHMMSSARAVGSADRFVTSACVRRGACWRAAIIWRDLHVFLLL